MKKMALEQVKKQLPPFSELVLANILNKMLPVGEGTLPLSCENELGSKHGGDPVSNQEDQQGSYNKYLYYNLHTIIYINYRIFIALLFCYL